MLSIAHLLTASPPQQSFTDTGGIELWDHMAGPKWIRKRQVYRFFLLSSNSSGQEGGKGTFLRLWLAFSLTFTAGRSGGYLDKMCCNIQL